MKKKRKNIIFYAAVICCIIVCLFIIITNVFNIELYLIKHHEMQLNEYTLKFYGDLEKTHILKVYEGSIRRATVPLLVENEIFDEANKLMPYLEDVNGDGHPDLFVPHSKDNNLDFRYAIFIWDNNSSMFTDTGVLCDLANIDVDLNENTVTSKMLLRTVVAEAQPNLPEEYELQNVYTEYKLADGAFVEYRKLSLTYYSESDIYCYSIYEYNSETKELECFDEQWMDAEEAKNITLP